MSRLLTIGARGTLYVGPLPRIDRHVHSAASVVVARVEPLRISPDGQAWTTSSSVYIPPGIPHAIDQRAADVAIFFLAPESDLQHHVVAHYGLPAARLSLDPAFPDGWAARSWAPSMTAADIHDEIVRLLAPGFVTRTESADERVAAVAERIRRESALNHPAANLAAMVHLSPSRLSALFTANVGMPMRRYRIWQRLRSAAAAIAEGYSYSDAAAMSGFADAAHFSSSTRHLFGVAPSDVLGSRPADTIRL